MQRRTLYVGNKNYSSWSMRPWLAMRHAGIEFDEVLIPLGTADSGAALRAASPTGRVPVLHDGDLVVWESLAICEYAAELAPAARLWPADRAARARARAVATEMHAGFGALRSAMPVNLRRPPRAVPRDARVEADIARVIDLWTECLRRRGAAERADGGGGFLFGHFTIADAMFAPVVCRFRSYEVKLAGEVARYAEAVWQLPAMQAWAEGAAAESWVIEGDEV